MVALLGLAFFWLTDPTFGPSMHDESRGPLDWRHWLFVIRGSPANVVDAARQMLWGTLFGAAGCVVMFTIGLGLMFRRAR